MIIRSNWLLGYQSLCWFANKTSNAMPDMFQTVLSWSPPQYMFFGIHGDKYGKFQSCTYSKGRHKQSKSPRMVQTTQEVLEADLQDGKV